MKISLFINNLKQGGAERVISRLADYLASKGHDVSLVTFKYPSDIDFYEVSNRVKRVPLWGKGNAYSQSGGVVAYIKRTVRIREKIKTINPDIIISFLTAMNVNVLLASLGLKKPIIVSERNHPVKDVIRRKDRLLRVLLYPLAKKVVMVAPRSLDWAKKRWPKWDAIAIGNAVLTPQVSSREVTLPGFGKRVVSAGRLQQQKGYDRLIKAFAEVVRVRSDTSLVILGDGDLRGVYESMISSLGLCDHVFLPGQVNPLNDYISKADLYVMSSHYEGFPNALAEAMACGLPVISFDCDYGPSDFIVDGENGWLVPDGDIDTLASKIIYALDNKEERIRLGNEAKTIADKWSVESTLKLWEQVIAGGQI